MEPTRPQAPSETMFSTSPRSSSFFDRVLRRNSSGSNAASRVPTLNLPSEPISSDNNTASQAQPRSRSRSSYKRTPLTIDTSIASPPYSSRSSNKKSKTTHLVVEITDRSSSRSRSRSRSRPARAPSPNAETINRSSRVASINHVGRHTNDWLFGGFHLTSKIGAPRGRRT